MQEDKRIGYIGVDVLNNATICNEAPALLAEGVPLEIASVKRFKKATFHRSHAVSAMESRLSYLYPIGFFRTIQYLCIAPFVFRRKWFSAIAAAFSCPSENWKAKLRVLFHLLPGLKLAFLWRQRNIGHIHAHWAHTATTVAMHAAKLLDVGFSFTGHANDLFVHRVGLVGKVRRAKFIVAISEYHRRFYLALGADPTRLEVVYCGIDSQRFSNPHVDNQPNNTSKVEPGPARIVTVGRLVEKKGFDDLIDACAILRDRKLHFECVIAGSGPLQASLVEHVKRLDLQKFVRITGETVLQEDLPRLLQTATVFALPCVEDSEGDRDGLPQVLIEAMLCGVPCVSTWLVGIPDLIRDGVNGLLVPPGRIGPLAGAIHTLLLDQDMRRRFSNEGHQWSLTHFSLREAIARLRTLFLWAAHTPPAAVPEKHFSAAPGATHCYGKSESVEAKEFIEHQARDSASTNA